MPPIKSNRAPNHKNHSSGLPKINRDSYPWSTHTCQSRPADQGLLPDAVALPCRQVGWLGLHPFPFDVSKKKQEAFESHSKRERKQRRRRSSTVVGKGRSMLLILALKRESAWCFYRRHGHGAFQDMCFYPFHHWRINCCLRHNCRPCLVLFCFGRCMRCGQRTSPSESSIFYNKQEVQWHGVGLHVFAVFQCFDEVHGSTTMNPSPVPSFTNGMEFQIVSNMWMIMHQPVIAHSRCHLCNVS